MTSQSSDDSSDDDDVTHESSSLLQRSQLQSAARCQHPLKTESEDCVFLFHGAHIENALSVVERGLPLQSDVKDNYFGQVAPLSECIYQADAYTNSEWYPRTTNLLLFIVRTSLTHAYRRLHSEHVPATIRSTHSVFVDGSDVGRRQVLVFDTKHCYPEYAVLYERVHKNVYWQNWTHQNNNTVAVSETYV